MIPKLLAFFLAAAFASPPVFAQKPGGKRLSETELLKQIESLTPESAAAGAKARANADAGPTSLLDSDAGSSKKSTDGSKEKTSEKKGKKPTEITAQEASFDQKANLAIFIGDVVVKDPEFNVECDKLTAYLKHEAKPAPDGSTPVKSPPKAATPKSDDAPPQKKSGGLEKAVAESTGTRRVTITQDKIEADGTTTKSFGMADKATYDTVTGDIILTGTPEVQQGINRVIATDPGTVMTLNRDGRMKAVGPHKTIIVDPSESGR